MYRTGQTVLVPTATAGDGTMQHEEFLITAALDTDRTAGPSWFRGVFAGEDHTLELLLPWDLTLAPKGTIYTAGHLGADIHAVTVMGHPVRPYVLAVQGASRYQGPFRGFFPQRRRDA